MVTGYGFAESRVTQNLGSGQREADHPTVFELAPGDREERW
jgi:hypothetical protein